MYAIYLPNAPLRPYIECFWFLQTNLTPPAQLEENIFTDGRADILFNFGAPYLRRNAGDQEQAHSLTASNLDAQRRYPVHIVQQGQLHLIGVRFRPAGLAAFLPMPMGQLAGLTLDLHNAFGPAGEELEYRLFETAGHRPQQLALLNTFFIRRLAVGAGHTLVNNLVATIEQHGGQITVRDLSRTYGYSIRTIDRIFQNVMGLSPKFYARIVRFGRVLNCLLHQPAAAWADIAAGYGYYDQPHFVKEFVEFTGQQPERYRAQLRREEVTTPPNHVQFLQDNSERMS
jgi:AraC-like DNA-binding protein